MSRRSFVTSVTLLALGAGLVATAGADTTKRCVDADFTPGENLQIVIWLEDGSGNFMDTLFITQQTGSFGLGNRPGRFDFNSGPLWPYGRRITTFPVWAHRNGQHFPAVLFQDLVDDMDQPVQDPSYCIELPDTADNYASCGENDLSHESTLSSREAHYCHPLLPSDPSWDAMTCPSVSFTDKGVFSTDPSFDTGYPPRADLTQSTEDSSSVPMYATLNPFDAVSQPTPVGGAETHVPWPVPDDLPDGNYVIYVETAKESDFNTTYNAQIYPSPPGIAWSSYGEPYRGQPSILYSVPITISAGSGSTGETMTFAGYGDPNGSDGAIRPPDSTITSDTPGSGGARLELVADGGDMYRLRVTAEPDDGSAMPGAIASVDGSDVTAAGATLSFIAPGVGSGEPVAGYDVRVRANDAMTADNFDDSTQLSTKVTPVDPGHVQTIVLSGLLPLTHYWVGVRAYNGCHDDGPLTISEITTTDRENGTVDACFIATAAYGSIMANDVDALRAFRDRWLRSNVVGELGVELYYTFGPAAAGVVGESDLLRQTARDALAPLVRAVKRLRR